MSAEEDMSSSYSSAGEESGDSELSNDSIYKEYGGMRNFMHSYGLKMYNDDDVEEAKAIATEMRRQDDQETELGGADLESEPANQRTRAAPTESSSKTKPCSKVQPIRPP